MEPRQCRDFDAAHALGLSHSQAADHSLCGSSYVDSRVGKTAVAADTSIKGRAFFPELEAFRSRRRPPEQFTIPLRRLLHEEPHLGM